MSTYNFDGFSPRDFQRFCASVISAERGNLVHPFTHKGRDGGIDAYSYDGKEVYQVKHHEVSYVGTQAANKLVIQDLGSELRSLLNQHKLSPTSFILITNVRLYPPTIIKLRELAEAIAPGVNTTVWDGGILEAKLDNSTSLRSAWSEQVGDIVNRLASEVDGLKAISNNLSAAERTLRKFLRDLSGQTPSDGTTFDELRTIAGTGDQDAEGRLRIVRILRGKTGNSVLRFLLSYFMVDYSLLLTFEKMDLPLLKDCLKETVRGIISCRSPAAALFLTGCLIHPFNRSSDRASAVDYICMDSVLEHMKEMDQAWFVPQFVSLYGKSRAVWLWSFLSHHVNSYSPDHEPTMMQIGRAIDRVQISAVALPSARSACEEIIDGDWIGDDYFQMPSSARDDMRAAFARHMSRLRSISDRAARVHVAVALSVEETLGITPYDCDFTEGSKYDLLTRFIREHVLVREIVGELRDVLGVSEEEFKRREEFSGAMDQSTFLMLRAGLSVLDIPFSRYSRSKQI